MKYLVQQLRYKNKVYLMIVLEGIFYTLGFYFIEQLTYELVTEKSLAPALPVYASLVMMGKGMGREIAIYEVFFSYCLFAVLLLLTHQYPRISLPMYFFISVIAMRLGYFTHVPALVWPWVLLSSGWQFSLINTAYLLVWLTCIFAGVSLTMVIIRRCLCIHKKSLSIEAT